MHKTMKRIISGFFAFIVIFAFSQTAYGSGLEIAVTTSPQLISLGVNSLVIGNLTLDGLPVSDSLVAIQVDDPANNEFIIRTRPTGTDLTGPWPVEILEMSPPESSIPSGGSGLFKVTVKNNGFSQQHVLVIFNAYYENGVPFKAGLAFETTLAPMENQSVTFPIGVPDVGACNGAATAYASALNDWPKNGGIAYCPEKSATFDITGGFPCGGSSPGNITSEDGTFNLPFRVPAHALLGDYTVYARSYHYPLYAANQTTFEVILVTDITGPENPPDSGQFPPDGKVDMRDISKVAKAFGSSPGHPRWDPVCDLTGIQYLQPDGKVDGRDLTLVARDFGKQGEI